MLSGLIIIALWYVSVRLFGGLTPIIAAVGGLLFSIPIGLFWQTYTRPVLEITAIEPRSFNPGDDRTWEYMANRIIVANIGRSAAKNCKAYLAVGAARERVCWTVPRERPSATINTNDHERLDFCAFYVSGPETRMYRGQNETIPRIIAPTEDGWQNPWECRRLDGIQECTVLVTADNTEPVERRVGFDIGGRRIEFI